MFTYLPIFVLLDSSARGSARICLPHSSAYLQNLGQSLAGQVLKIICWVNSWVNESSKGKEFCPRTASRSLQYKLWPSLKSVNYDYEELRSSLRSYWQGNLDWRWQGRVLIFLLVFFFFFMSSDVRASPWSCVLHDPPTAIQQISGGDLMGQTGSLHPGRSTVSFIQSSPLLLSMLKHCKGQRRLNKQGQEQRLC